MAKKRSKRLIAFPSGIVATIYLLGYTLTRDPRTIQSGSQLQCAAGDDNERHIRPARALPRRHLLWNRGQTLSDTAHAFLDGSGTGHPLALPSCSERWGVWVRDSPP